MIDLIKEIEKLKVYECEFERSQQNIVWMKDCYIKEDLENLLNQYNIITAPKEIKLSELIDKIYETKFKSECWIEPIRLGKGHYRIRTQYGDGYWGDYDFYIENEKIVIYTNDCLLPFNEFKFLYTLWIAGTTIIDDLEGKE